MKWPELPENVQIRIIYRPYEEESEIQTEYEAIDIIDPAGPSTLYNTLAEEIRSLIWDHEEVWKEILKEKEQPKIDWGAFLKDTGELPF